MSSYAYVTNGLVREIVPPHPDGFTLAERFPVAYAASCIPIPDALPVDVGWTYEGDAFAPPAAEPQPEPVRYVRVAVLRRRLQAAGKWEDAVNALTNAQLIWLVTLESGVDVTDPAVTGLLEAVGADVEATLAPGEE